MFTHNAKKTCFVKRHEIMTISAYLAALAHSRITYFSYALNCDLTLHVTIFDDSFHSFKSRYPLIWQKKIMREAVCLPFGRFLFRNGLKLRFVRRRESLCILVMQQYMTKLMR